MVKFHMSTHQKSYECSNTLVGMLDQGFVKVMRFFFGVRVNISEGNRDGESGTVGT